MNRPTRVDVDTHVHIYDIFDRVRLVEAAAARGRSRGRPAVLALTETAGRHAFEALGDGTAAGGLEVTATADREALAVRAARGDDDVVVVVAGRQLVSSERLEVLALGLTDDDALARVPDGTRPASALVEAALEAGAVCVLPWSVGKWLGARGRLVERLVDQAALRGHPRFFAGDIAARARPWPRPAAFDRPVRLLCGTDPLPIPGAEVGVLRYGSSVEGTWAPERPWTSVRVMLESADRVDVVGRRDGLFRALADQLRLRANRRS